MVGWLYSDEPIEIPQGAGEGAGEGTMTEDDEELPVTPPDEGLKPI